MRSFLVAVVGFAVAASATDTWNRQEQDVPVHNPETSSWAKGGRAPAAQPMSLTVALRVEDERVAELERILYEVSDPDHVKYGQHLSIDAITELLAVPAHRVERVKSYFVEAGATAVVAPNRDMITVTMPVSAVEAALKTTIHVFTHNDHTDVSILRASQHYSLPAEIDEHVTMVGELLQFPRFASVDMGSNANAGGGDWPNGCKASGCNGLVTPAVLAQRYKLPTTLGASDVASGNTMAVAEFQGQYFVEKDLTAFSESCNRDVKVDKVIGGNKPSAGIESELDIEYIRSVAPSVPLTVVYSDQFSLLSWANQITSMSDAPLIHSVSYGNDERQQSGLQYMYTCNQAFMKAGVRGLSILFASGDQGVCGRSGCGMFSVRFKPDFPAGSPYITAVGGTNFAGTGIGDEAAWDSSGGGFSDTFGIPAYQQAAVSAYKSSPDAKLPPQAWWNNTGRGYPDVAALGGQKTPYCVEVSGSFSGVAGTSASCPVVAGVFARLNGLRLAKGGKPMGFLNPFIYKNPSGFQDVKVGRNGAGRAKCGFSATKGWDPATGFGTPDYEVLSKLVIASPTAIVVV